MNRNDDQSFKTIEDMKGPDYYSLIRNLELSSETDVEKISNFFLQSLFFLKIE